MSKGTRVYSLRCPPDLMAEIVSFVERNQDRDQEGNLTVTKFILQSCRERLGKLERAKRSAQRTAAKKRGGVLHHAAEDASQPISSFADTDLSAGIDSAEKEG